MKNYTTLLIAILTTISIYSQDIIGNWQGKLNVGGIELRIVLHINKNDTTYTATMDSPDQGAKGIPVNNTVLDGKTFSFEVPTANIKYNGTLKNDRLISGMFNQNGQSYSLDFNKLETGESVKINRPQEPKPPYPYKSEEIKFPNTKDSIVLAGTLTLPQNGKKFPAVVLISGSGPQNRDEEIFNHKPFLVIADYLTRKGIAVLRYDDRGTAASTGDFNSSTSLDFATDVEYAIEYLKTRKEINKKKIGLIGHSEGAMIAPMVASKSKDVNFIVLLAGLGMTGEEILVLQNELIGKAYNLPSERLETSNEVNKVAYQIIKQSNNPDSLYAHLSIYFNQALSEHPELKPSGMPQEVFLNSQLSKLTRPWMKYFLSYDPKSDLTTTNCPILALYGNRDLQVPPNENLKGIKKSIEKGGNNKFTSEIFPDLNHMFQTCKTGLPIEYGQIEETFSPIVLERISTWIIKNVQ